MNRTARTVQLAEPLWTALETMSREMGVDREVLLGQAIFSLARQFGFITPTQINLLDAAAAPSPTPAEGAPIEDVRTEAHREATGEEEAAPPPEEEEEAVAAAGSEAAPEDTPDAGQEAAEGQAGNEDEAGAEAEVGAGAELPSGAEEIMAAIEKVSAPVPDPVESAGEKPRAAKPAGRVDRTIIVQPGRALHVQLEQGEPVRITRERFILGRGSHCDLVVKSAKVSREHAVVVREGAEYFIEDLRSSNGTWFQDTRVTRHHVSDGDEYLLGGIPITFTFQ
jgi:hypothetical protein